MRGNRAKTFSRRQLSDMTIACGSDMAIVIEALKSTCLNLTSTILSLLSCGNIPTPADTNVPHRRLGATRRPLPVKHIHAPLPFWQEGPKVIRNLHSLVVLHMKCETRQYVPKWPPRKAGVKNFGLNGPKHQTRQCSTECKIEPLQSFHTPERIS
jgi:hypothetical protein